MVNLKRCRDVIEAETLRIRLASAGIHAVVQGGQTATALSYVGSAVGYPQVEVADDDYQSAVAILEADRVALATAGGWICSRCDEYNEPSFDICWSCSKTRGPEDRVETAGANGLRRQTGDDASDESEPPFTLAGFKEKDGNRDSDNPYRPLDWQGDRADVSDQTGESLYEVEDTQTIDRAYTAAIIGMFMPMILIFNAYSIYLLVRLSLGRRPTRPPRTAKWYAAWAINALGIVIGALILMAVA